MSEETKNNKDYTNRVVPKIQPLEFLYDSELQRMHLYQKINEIIKCLNAVTKPVDAETVRDGDELFDGKIFRQGNKMG